VANHTKLKNLWRQPLLFRWAETLFVTTTPALWIKAIFPSFPRSCLLLIQEILLIIALGYRKRHWEHSLRLHLFCSITNLCLNFARQHFYNEPSRGIANLLL
jgi:hypothetical protein